MIEATSRIVTQPDGYLPVEQSTGDIIIWDGEKVVNGSVTFKGSYPLLGIRMTNGLEIKCTGEQEFKTMQKRLQGESWTKAEDLTENHLLYFGESTFAFDTLDLKCYKYLSKLNSEELGTLVGIFKKLSVIPGTLDIPLLRRETYRKLQELLDLCGVGYEKEEYFRRTERLKYIIENEEFLEEIQHFVFIETLPEEFWRSKPFMKGLLKALFTFATIGTEMFILKAPSDSKFLFEVQKALLLFAINSSYTKGFRASSLIVSKNNCYRLAHRIGVFNAENLFTGIDMKRILVYKDDTLMDMKYGSIHRIDKMEAAPVFKVEAERFMVNGIVAR